MPLKYPAARERTMMRAGILGGVGLNTPYLFVVLAIMVLALVAATRLPPRKRLAAAAGIVLLAVIVIAAAVVWFLNPNVRTLARAALWPIKYYAVYGDFAAAPLPLPEHTAQRFRNSPGSVQYYSLVTPSDAQRFFSGLAPAGDMTLVSANASNITLILHYRNVEYEVQIAPSGHSCCTIWVKFVRVIGGPS